MTNILQLHQTALDEVVQIVNYDISKILESILKETISKSEYYQNTITNNALHLVSNWINTSRNFQSIIHKNLGAINLSNCKISTIPNELFILEHLQVLDLSRNKITKVSNRIGKLQQLHFLDVSHNLFEDLPIELYCIENLKYINLQNNLITDIHPDISNLKKLIMINLRHNKISDEKLSIVKNLLVEIIV